MNVIILSGGSGKRLWPLSNDIRSKQFLKIFRNDAGQYESMVQKMYSMIKNLDGDISVTIATSDNQVPLIKEQLGESVGISVEPCRRDTFAAIALAVAYVHDIKGKGVDESVVVCPVDPYVEQDYFLKLRELSELSSTGAANLVLMGIEPTYASEKYGYIIPKSKQIVSEVKYFKEKPDKEIAKEYIRQGALWNAGVFSFKIGYVLDIADRIFGVSTYKELEKNYDKLPKISFDYAIVEQEKSIQVIRFSGAWEDLGTWGTLTEVLGEKIIGKAICADDCENVHVINEQNIPIIAMGLKNVAIVASTEGILVVEKESSDQLKKYVELIEKY